MSNNRNTKLTAAEKAGVVGLSFILVILLTAVMYLAIGALVGLVVMLTLGMFDISVPYLAAWFGSAGVLYVLGVIRGVWK